MQTAGQIIARAMQAAKAPLGISNGYTTQAAGLLNAILSDLCETYDLAVARGLYTFNFAPQMTAMIGGQDILASGPYFMPLDYLRTSGSSGSEGTQKSVFWLYQGVPYPMIPCDLSEFDMQVQQAGISSYPWLWATDMSQRVIARTSTANVHSNTVLDNILNPAGVIAGMTVLGPGLAYGTTIASIAGNAAVLSAPASLTAAGGNYDFGYPAAGYAYPPPSGAFPVTCRYQRQMPDLALDGMGNLTSAAAASTPWFPNIGFLEEELAGRLMKITDDARADVILGNGLVRGRSGMILDKYLKMKDDDQNRAKTVQLDRRRFGRQFPMLPNTKTIGW